MLVKNNLRRLMDWVDHATGYRVFPGSEKLQVDYMSRVMSPKSLQLFFDGTLTW